MNLKELIHIEVICEHYNLQPSFLNEIHYLGLLELQFVQDSTYLHQEEILVLEKIINMEQELNINLAGIEVIIKLLDKIEQLQTELKSVKNRLDIYEKS